MRLDELIASWLCETNSVWTVVNRQHFPYWAVHYKDDFTNATDGQIGYIVLCYGPSIDDGFWHPVTIYNDHVKIVRRFCDKIDRISAHDPKFFPKLKRRLTVLQKNRNGHRYVVRIDEQIQTLSRN